MVDYADSPTATAIDDCRGRNHVRGTLGIDDLAR